MLCSLKLVDEIRILEPNEVPDNFALAAISVVRAPAARERYIKPIHLIKAVQLPIMSGVDIDGLIPSEVGAFSSVSEWIVSLVLGLPVADLPCNGRAHPMALMGSMGLHRLAAYYLFRQSVVGGDPAKSRHVELLVSARPRAAESIVRRAAVEAGGVVAVAGNPIDAEYAKRYGAPGALGKAFRVGNAIAKLLDDGKHREACYIALDEAGGEVVDECTLKDASLETRESFDVGTATLSCGKEVYTVRFVNEYITLDRGSDRVATFPDLIVLMNMKTGLPVISAELSDLKGEQLLLGYVPKEKLALGYGVRHSEAYDVLEDALGVKIKDHLKGFLIE